VELPCWTLTENLNLPLTLAGMAMMVASLEGPGWRAPAMGGALLGLSSLARAPARVEGSAPDRRVRRGNDRSLGRAHVAANGPLDAGRDGGLREHLVLQQLRRRARRAGTARRHQPAAD